MPISDTIAIRVLLFAGARSALGMNYVDVTMPAGATMADLRGELANRFPRLAPLIASSRFALQTDFAADDTVFHQAAEIAWIPPVSGG
jgi:molybdopterin synthase catalytic subunit/molybdopterin synthase sulfur carrier subunit